MTFNQAVNTLENRPRDVTEAGAAQAQVTRRYPITKSNFITHQRASTFCFIHVLLLHRYLL